MPYTRVEPISDKRLDEIRKSRIDVQQNDNLLDSELLENKGVRKEYNTSKPIFK